jgi:hypothetical protein
LECCKNFRHSPDPTISLWLRCPGVERLLSTIPTQLLSPWPRPFIVLVEIFLEMALQNSKIQALLFRCCPWTLLFPRLRNNLHGNLARVFDRA